MRHLSRRAFLTGLGSSLAFAPPRAFAANSPAEARYVAAADLGSAGHVARVFDGFGRVHHTMPLPGRGHGFAYYAPTGQCVALARRPGLFARVFDVHTGRILHDISASEGRHFYGHGVFSHAGDYLLTSENNFADGQGVIGIRDARRGFELVGEFPSHGIGPHEIALLPESQILVVANGGIRTDPSLGRQKLNLDTMSSSLAYIELASGALLGRWRLPEMLHRLSMRHLAVGPTGSVAIAMQFEGARNQPVPLVGWHDRGDTIALLRAPKAVERQMRQYCGSASMSADGWHFAVSSPRGNLVTYWDVSSRHYVGTASIPDGSGLAPGVGAEAFMMTSGAGGIFAGDAGGLKRLDTEAEETCRWDNHLLHLAGI